MTLKTNAPFYIELVTPWIQDRLRSYFKLPPSSAKRQQNFNLLAIHKEDLKNDSLSTGAKDTRPLCKINVDKLVSEIDAKFISVWYNELSDDKTFKEEANELLRKLLKKISVQICAIDEMRLAHKLADLFLLHLKEYRRAFRRVKKGTAPDIQEAYRCTHPGSRSASTLEHTLHCLVNVLAGEFLQWELTSSLPCKLLLSLLAKRLLEAIRTFACPRWIFHNWIVTLKSTAEKNEETFSDEVDKNVSSPAKKVCS